VNKYIILLRGINVGGTNKVAMKDLTSALLQAGYAEVKTYIQSGNLVLTAGNTDKQQVATSIAELIAQHFGFKPQVLVLSQAEYSAALTANPYKEAEATPSALHLYFLDTKPANPDLDKLAKLKADTERYQLNEQVFYLHAPDGIGRSKLAATAEKALGVPATGRNWRSAIKILELAQQD
tara:strand:- start:482 stop:1021 length:540 start_codon:yes stop_codon:yes gene_type:complete